MAAEADESAAAHRVRAENAVLRTRLKALWDSLADPVLSVLPVLDEAGEVADFLAVEANGEACRRIGRAPGDLAGRPLSELLPPGAVAHVRAWCEAVVRSGEPLAVDDVPIQDADGNDYRWFDVRVGTLVDEVVLSWREVTERHQIAHQLAQAEENYRVLADNATDVILRTGTSRTVEWASPSVTDVLGWPVAEVLGRPVPELMHPVDLAAMVADMRALRQAGKSGGRFQARFRTASGGWRWMSGAGRALLDDDGRVVGGIDTLRDMQDEHDATVALQASDAHFRLLAENTSDVVVQLTTDGRIAWVSPSVERILGWLPDQVKGRSGFTLVHPEDGQALTAVLTGEDWVNVAKVRAVRVRRPDGGYLWMEASTQHVAATAAAPESLVTRLRDIDSQRRAFHDLARSEERFRTAMASAPIGMAVGTLAGGLTEANPALCAMLGRSPHWLRTHPLREVVHRDDEDTFRSMREAVFETEAESLMRELRLVTADEQVVRVQLAVGIVRDEIGEPTSLVWQIMDVTDTRRAQEVLEFLADHDPLTDVKNRRAVLGTLTTMLGAGAAAHPRVGVIYADIDGLKPVNDQLGHAAGDTLIIEVSRRISRVLGSGDTIGRLGGDEFVVILSDVSALDEVSAVAERVGRAVSEPLDIDGVGVDPAVSLGVACALPQELPEALLRRADHALYRAKQAGGNCVVADRPEGASSD